MNKEYAHIVGKLKDAAETVIEYSPLNTDRTAREHHTARLLDDFLTTVEVYLDENTPNTTHDETAHYRDGGEPE